MTHEEIDKALAPTHLDLFSGIGGFSLALEACGFRTVAFSEIDKFASHVLAHHWPDIPNLGDITKLDGNQISDEFGAIGVVTFGSPCQDLSVAGKRAGLVGARSSLFHEAIRIIRDLRPTLAIWENVAGAFSSGSGWDFATVLDSLAECGALDIAWRVLDAQFAGVPQRRDRIFVVADFRGVRAGEILSLTEGVRRNFASRGKAGEDVAGSLGGGSGARGWCDDTDRATFVADTASTLNAHYGDKWGLEDQHINQGAPLFVIEQNTQCSTPKLPSCRARETPNYAVLPIQSVNSVREKKQNGIGIAEDGDPMYSLTGRDQHAVMFDFKQSGETDPTMRALSHDKSHANGGSHLAVATFDERNITSKANRSRVEAGRPCHSLHSDAPAICLDVNKSANEGSWQGIQVEHTNALRTDKMPAVSKGSMGVRRLTPTECERLMGFPDGWTALPKAADGPRYRVLGNAVVPCVVRQIAERISRAVEARQ